MSKQRQVRKQEAAVLVARMNELQRILAKQG